METSQPTSPTETLGSALWERQSLVQCSKRFEDVKSQCVDCLAPCGVRLKSAFDEVGFACMPGTLPSAAEFSGMYELFSAVFGPDADPTVLGHLEREADLWNSLAGNISAYSAAPVGFRDRRVRMDKSNKSYFQFTREFGYFLRGLRNGSYEASVGLRRLCSKLDEIAEHSERTFRASLRALALAYPDELPAKLCDGPSSILIKVLAYYPGEEWATVRHFDKSLLTLVLGASDLESDKLRIGPFDSGRLGKFMIAPQRQVHSSTSPGTGVLFPGLMWKKLGIDFLKPSPHAVLPVNDAAVRYSAIAFLIAPDLDTSDLMTNIM